MTDKELVEALCEIEEGLTDWEVEFVESLHNQAEGKSNHTWRMSPKQLTIAERIWTEKGPK